MTVAKRVRGWRRQSFRRHFHRGFERLKEAAWCEPGEKVWSSALWSRGYISGRQKRGPLDEPREVESRLLSDRQGKARNFIKYFRVPAHRVLASPIRDDAVGNWQRMFQTQRGRGDLRVSQSRRVAPPGRAGSFIFPSAILPAHLCLSAFGNDRMR